MEALAFVQCGHCIVVSKHNAFIKFCFAELNSLFKNIAYLALRKISLYWTNSPPFDSKQKNAGKSHLIKHRDTFPFMSIANGFFSH